VSEPKTTQELMELPIYEGACLSEDSYIWVADGIVWSNGKAPDGRAVRTPMMFENALPMMQKTSLE
jgi:hypothetical protein